MNTQTLLEKYFGFKEFRPLQKNIVDSVLGGRDCFVLMPTGGGKSLCYQLPALKLPGITLVISPLIALMKDQVDGLKANGIEAEFLGSSLTPEKNREVMEKVRKQRTKILYISPEKFANPGFREFLKQQNVSLVAVDEAHCISEWGHDFRPDYGNLKILKDIFPSAPILALTATATPGVKEDILTQLGITEAASFASGFDRTNLNLTVVEKKKAFPKLLALLDKHPDESVIIYCFSRKETEEIADNLNQRGFQAQPYHAGMEKQERKTAQERFVKDRVNIIVATIAFGMGIDKPDVRLIVHYTFPKTIEGYYQEIGRAGRDGLASDCVMFYTYADLRKHEFFLNRMTDSKLQKSARNKLNDVLDYAELTTCRRRFLLNYFGEEYEASRCDGCDICLTEQETLDATVIIQKILSCILKTGSRFGKNYVLEVLLGKNTQRIRRNGHDQLSVFGLARDWPEEELGQIMIQLLRSDLLSKTGDSYPVLALTRKGKTFLKNRETIELPKPRADIKTKKKEREEDLDYNQELFSRLRELRKKLAEAANLPPFVIFGDQSLQQMAAYMPQTREEFGRINGVGETKLKKYADDFLQVITGFLKEKGMAPPGMPSHLEFNSDREPRLQAGRKYAKTRELLNKKIPLKDIAKHQNLKPDTIVNHIERLLDAGANLDLEYLKLPRGKYEEIKTAFDTIGDEFLKPVFQYLEGKYDYEDLRLVRVIKEN